MSDPHAAAGAIPALYQRHAALFESLRGDGRAERPWLDRFRAAMPGPRLLDLGCGTGRPLAAWLAGQGCRITGLDAAPAMIEQARAHLPGHRWEVGDLRRLDLGETFDGILAWCSLFHLTPEAQRAALPRLRAHAAPGAALMFTSGTDEGTAMGEFGGEPLYHGSLSTAEYRDRLGALGFEILAHVVSDPDCGGLTVWLARLPGVPSGLGSLPPPQGDPR